MSQSSLPSSVLSSPLFPWLSVHFSEEEHWTGMTKKSSLLAYVIIQLFPTEFSPLKGQNDTYILSHRPRQQWTSCKHMLSALWTWEHLLLRFYILSRNWGPWLWKQGQPVWKERPGNETHCTVHGIAPDPVLAVRLEELWLRSVQHPQRVLIRASWNLGRDMALSRGPAAHTFAHLVPSRLPHSAPGQKPFQYQLNSSTGDVQSECQLSITVN